MKRVTFTFDKHFFARLSEPIGPIMADTNPPPVQMTAIALRDPRTGEERVMYLPAVPIKCPYCGK